LGVEALRRVSRMPAVAREARPNEMTEGMMVPEGVRVGVEG
jgi:hypothetical protein